MSKPAVPQNLMVSVDTDNQYAVLHRDQVTKDIDAVDTTILSYKIYVAYQTNLKDIAALGNVITMDMTGKIDTIYIDYAIDLTKNAFYKVSAVNLTGEGDPSEVGFDLIELKKHG